jgi:triacylglycerol lipase
MLAPSRSSLATGAALSAALVLSACGSTGDDAGFRAISGGTGGAGGSATSAGGSGGATTDATTSSTGGSGPTKLGPPYPVVLAHGFFGFEKFAGLDFVTYFYHVKDELAKDGEIVYTPAVDPFNDSTYRGAQLEQAIEQILAETGYAKVNLIGHSQGGLDARVVAHDRPDLVASVVTVATPHRGTPIADVALKLLADPKYQDVLDWIVNAIGAPLYDQVGDETAVSKPLHLFSQPGIQAFNAKYPDAPGIPYWSVAGRSNMSDGGYDCDPMEAVSFLSQYDATKDPLDALFSVTEPIVAGGFDDEYPNDGLVRAKDARWGTFLGCVPADHLDEIGQLFGDGPGAGNDFDHVALYRDLIAFLRSKGY